MNKIKRRALIAVALALLLTAGIGWYLVSYIKDGVAWVAFPSNRHIYKSGSLQTGTLTDRDGVILASCDNGVRVFADDETLRLAALHVVGDANGKIGTGALTKFAERLTGFSPTAGLFYAASDAATLALTIDADISKAAYKALGDYDGAVLAYNYKTGAILCAVSKPSYDPENVPADLDTNPAYDGVYINRCFRASYAPGSTMKLITAAAALETLDDPYDIAYTCDGSCVIDGRKINCQNVHGKLTLARALAQSCNVYFAHLSMELGGETLKDYADAYGLTSSCDISGIATLAGRFDAHKDGTAELAWAGIGQSTDLVCPASMLRFLGAAANGGSAAEPKLLPDGKTVLTPLVKPETAAALTELMRNNTRTVYGDGSFPKGLEICAKSGTAQVDGEKSNAWFVGFSANEKYPVAFVVIAEHAGAGSGVGKDVAAAVLRAVVKG
jgi:cell division protein FtsI/penicillin-binding protein 2